MRDSCATARCPACMPNGPGEITRPIRDVRRGGVNCSPSLSSPETVKTAPPDGVYRIRVPNVRVSGSTVVLTIPEIGELTMAVTARD